MYVREKKHFFKVFLMPISGLPIHYGWEHMRTRRSGNKVVCVWVYVRECMWERKNIFLKCFLCQFQFCPSTMVRSICGPGGQEIRECVWVYVRECMWKRKHIFLSVSYANFSFAHPLWLGAYADQEVRKLRWRSTGFYLEREINELLMVAEDESLLVK